MSLPDDNGSVATAKIKEYWPEAKVLALSMYEDKSDVRMLLEAGASGYVLKRSATEELIRAIRVVASGDFYLDPSLSAVMAETLVDRRTGRVKNFGTKGGISLSAREQEVLKQVSQGLTNKEIAGKACLSVKTVETYKTRSMEKLGLDSRADIVRYAVMQGWLNELL